MYRKIYEGGFRFPKWTSPNLRRFLLRLLDPNPTAKITVEVVIRDPCIPTGGVSRKTNFNFLSDEFDLKATSGPSEVGPNPPESDCSSS